MILKLSKRNFLIVCFTFLFSCISFANDDSAVEEKPAFNINETIFGHIGDNHDWHMWDYNGHAVGFPLPVILVNTNPFSIDVFMSSEFEHGHKTVTKGDHTYKMVAKEMGGQDIFYVENGEVTDKGPLDFSITKNVFTLFLVAIIMLVMFIGCARAYKRRPGQAPKGFQAWLEPVILFIKEDVIEPNLGRHADKYTPYLLTVFFFIWISNMMGLIPFFPGSANLTGNIAVTFVLAVFTLLITNFSVD